MFNHEAEAEVTLQNTGKVGFEYSIVDPELEVQAVGVKEKLDVVDETDSVQASELWPGRPTVVPDTVSWFCSSSVGTRECSGSSLRSCVRVFFCFFLFLCARQGYIEAGSVQTLRVLYLPGVPDVFEKQLQLKVAFLPPQIITLTGEGIFPRINLDLPTNLGTHSPALYV